MSNVRRIGFAIAFYGLYLAVMGIGGIILHIQYGLRGGGLARVIEPWSLAVGETGLLGIGLFLALSGVGLARLRPWARSALEFFLWGGIFVAFLGGIALLISSIGRISQGRIAFASTVTLAHLVAMGILLAWIRSERVRTLLRVGHAH